LTAGRSAQRGANETDLKLSHFVRKARATFDVNGSRNRKRLNFVQQLEHSLAQGVQANIDGVRWRRGGLFGVVCL
jgi:hypothetical protein